MDCRYVRERLPAMMFDELDGRERQVMQPHMGSCADCQAEEHASKRIFMVVQTAVRSGGWVPDRFTDNVVAKLPAPRGKRLRHDPMNLRLLNRMTQMAASVLLGVTFVGLYVIYYDHLPHFGKASRPGRAVNMSHLKPFSRGPAVDAAHMPH